MQNQTGKIAAEFAAAVAATLGKTTTQPDHPVDIVPIPEQPVVLSGDSHVEPHPEQTTSPPSDLANIHQPPQPTPALQPQQPQPSGAIQTQTVSLSNGDTTGSVQETVTIKTEEVTSVSNSGDIAVDVTPQQNPAEPVTVSVKSTERPIVSATESSFSRETTPEVHVVPPTPVDKTSPELVTELKAEAPIKTQEPTAEVTGNFTCLHSPVNFSWKR